MSAIQSAIESFVATAPTAVLATGGVLAALVLIFIVVFLFPGVLHWFRLLGMQRRIRNFQSKNFVSEFKDVFTKDKRLTHLWKEYQDSLHIQREEREGQMVVMAVRATVPAEVYFNSQFVVDSRLRTEFFKHLPGLFTGIGIIGTFSGLIAGLRLFQVSENAATVRASLESLMHSVGEAFLISASAIAAAMLVTFIEKLLLASLYRRTEEIAHAIDACFDSGAGEEYLSRLVKASEESASQSKILKDALVKELGELLRELTSAQIAASKEQQLHLTERLAETSREQLEATRQDNQALGETITASIEQSLKGPMQEIADSVKAASGDQSANAARMLQDVMASFSQRLNDLFGGQISGLSDLNQQTSAGMKEAVSALQQLVENLEHSSSRATSSMAGQIAGAIEQMGTRQDAMNSESVKVVEQVRLSVAESQSESTRNLQLMLETIGSQVAGMLSALSESQVKVFEENRSREQSMTDRAQNAVGKLHELVASTEESSKRATDTMAERMAEAIEKMVARQETMNSQSAVFIEQLRQMVSASQSETNQKLQTTLETIGTEVAGLLATLSESQAKVFEGNRAREQSMTDRARTAVSSMSDSVEAAIREMSASSAQMAQNVATLTQATSSSVDKMNAGAENLGTAAKNFATAGERVTNVMSQAANVSAKLSETSGALTSGSAAMQDLLRDYKLQRDSVGLIVTELRSTVEAARREASMTGDALARIEASAKLLSTAHKQADEYLDGVSKVLGDAHTSFATEVKRTLDKANTEFHTKLSAAVGMLSSGVSELELTLASMGALTPVRKSA